MSEAQFFECLLLLIQVLCLIGNLLLFIEAIYVWRRVCRSSENHGAREWSLSRINAKGCLLVAQILLLSGTADIVLRLLWSNWTPTELERLHTFGIVRFMVSVLMLGAAWINTQAYRSVRKADREARDKT